MENINIISASRRTDIPRFYSRWFSQRRSEGFAEFRNSFGGKGKVSLRDENIAGFLFWTRFARPFARELSTLLSAGHPCVFQHTITGYGKSIEPHTLSTRKAMDDFLATADMLAGPESIQWRYDPIVICNDQPVSWHLENFEKIASTLQGAAKVVNISFIEPYLKTVRRIQDPTILFRHIDSGRHKTVQKRYPDTKELDWDTGSECIRSLAAIAKRYGMELRICANDEWNVPQAQCCGVELFAPYGTEVTSRIADFAPGPSRPGCRCLKTVDIGMDNTCLGGCRYCYVVNSQQLAGKNFKNHRTDMPMLRMAKRQPGKKSP